MIRPSTFIKSKHPETGPVRAADPYSVRAELDAIVEILDYWQTVAWLPTPRAPMPTLASEPRPGPTIGWLGYTLPPAVGRWLEASGNHDVTIRARGTAGGDRKYVVLLHTRQAEHFKPDETRSYAFTTKSCRANSLQAALKLAADWCVKQIEVSK